MKGNKLKAVYRRPFQRTYSLPGMQQATLKPELFSLAPLPRSPILSKYTRPVSAAYLRRKDTSSPRLQASSSRKSLRKEKTVTLKLTSQKIETTTPSVRPKTCKARLDESQQEIQEILAGEPRNIDIHSLLRNSALSRGDADIKCKTISEMERKRQFSPPSTQKKQATRRASMLDEALDVLERYF